MTILVLPLRLEGCQILDANDWPIALVRGEMAEYREWGAEIIAAVNSHADLLAAAKELLRIIELTGRVEHGSHAVDLLQAAIAKVEKV